MNKRYEGTKYEAISARYLEEEGYRIIGRNFRCRSAEIDLIAREGKYIVFVEVKQRSSSSRGYGYEAVNGKKQSRICQAVRFYMRKYHIGQDIPVRFDVISIDGGKIRLIRDAFPYTGHY